MIDLPIGKAIIAVPLAVQCNDECMQEGYKCPIDCCKGCEMHNDFLEGVTDKDTCFSICCSSGNRKDGKQVIFKLIDYPVK